ncbi:MAG: hypothetical protein QW117_01285 [Candidatus Pacearchaeota archaeon]
MLISKRKLFVGIDESNHGKYPEIFVAAYSNKEEYSIYLQNPIKKDRKHLELNEKLRKVRYNFLILQEYDINRMKEVIKKDKRINLSVRSIVFSSLLKGITRYYKDYSLEILIDGDLKIEELKSTKSLISKIERIPEENIFLYSGIKFDEHILIVNYADEIAHFLFRKKTLEDIISEKYCSIRKELIL